MPGRRTHDLTAARTHGIVQACLTRKILILADRAHQGAGATVRPPNLWALIAPLRTPWPEKPPGPRPVPDRLCLQGILCVLHIGHRLATAAPEAGVRLSQTCWRWLKRWPPRACEPSSGPGHEDAVTGARGSATAEGADGR